MFDLSSSGSDAVVMPSALVGLFVSTLGTPCQSSTLLLLQSDIVVVTDNARVCAFSSDKGV